MEDVSSITTIRYGTYPKWEVYDEYDENFDKMMYMLNAGVKKYVRVVDRLNEWLGALSMYLLLLLMGILLFSIAANGIRMPVIWTMEMAQFTMGAYYILGGGYSLKHNVHVRMDVFYERWTPRFRALADVITATAVIFFMVMLFKGGVDSSVFALEFGQRNHSVWGPYMAPIKIIMTFGILMMLLQVIAQFFRDFYVLIGRDINK